MPLKSIVLLVIVSFCLQGCPAEKSQESPPPKLDQAVDNAHKTTKASPVDPNAPVGEPPDQRTMLLASYTGCFEMNQETESSVSRTTLQIDMAPGNELKEREKIETLEFSRDTPDVHEESSILQVQELEETTLVFQRYYEGAESGVRGAYSWVEGKFYVTDSRGQRRGPFESCE